MSSDPARVLIRHYFISRRYSVRCPTNTILLHIAQLLCYCEKDNLFSLLDSGMKIIYWSKLTMQSSRVQPWVRGGSEGSFPEQRLVIEPTKTDQDDVCKLGSVCCALSPVPWSQLRLETKEHFIGWCCQPSKYSSFQFSFFSEFPVTKKQKTFSHKLLRE